MEGDSSTTESSYRVTIDVDDLPIPKNAKSKNPAPPADYKNRGLEKRLQNTSTTVESNLQASTTLQLLKKMNSENLGTIKKLGSVNDKINRFNSDFTNVISKQQSNRTLSNLPPAGLNSKNKPFLDVKDSAASGTSSSKNSTPLRRAPDPPSSKSLQVKVQNSQENRPQATATPLAGNFPSAPQPSPKPEMLAQSTPVQSQTGSHSHDDRPTQQEILTLRRKLNEVTEKNIAWQKYNEEREDYVRGLFQKNQALNVENLNCKNEVAKLKSHPEELATEQRQYLDKIIANLQSELKCLHVKFGTAQNENNWFQSNYDTSLEEIRVLKSKLKNSKSELKHEKGSKIFKDETSKALKQRIELLESNNYLLEKQLEKATRQITCLERKNSQIELSLIKKTNKIKELEEKRRSISELKNREKEIFGKFDKLADSYGKQKPDGTPPQHTDAFTSNNFDKWRLPNGAVSPPSQPDWSDFDLFKEGRFASNKKQRKVKTPINKKILDYNDNVEFEDKNNLSRKEILRLPTSSSPAKNKQKVPDIIYSAREAPKNTTERRSKSEESQNRNKSRKRHSFDESNYNFGSPHVKVRSRTRERTADKNYNNSRQQTPIMKLNLDFDPNPLVLRYSAENVPTGKSTNRSGRSTDRSKRRQTVIGSGRNKTKVLEKTSKFTLHNCDFCGASFVDYKKLIRHYDVCDEI